METTRYVLVLLSEAAKAVGRIFAGIALLHGRICFIALRIGMAVEAGFAAWRLLTGSQEGLWLPLALVFLGIALIFWTHRVTGLPGSKKQVITGGPFALVRHPMYSGWCLAALGAAWIGNCWVVWCLALAQVIFMLSVSCAEDEENAMIFGDPYIQYSKSVWLTGVLIGLIRYLIRRAFWRSKMQVDCIGQAQGNEE